MSAFAGGVDSNQEFFDHLSAQQVLFDDPVEVLRSAARIPGPLGVDDGDRPFVADPQAVCLGSLDSALLREPQLLQPLLEVVPRFKRLLESAAFGLGLVTAEKDVPARRRHSKLLHDAALLPEDVFVFLLVHLSLPGLRIPCFLSREMRVLRLRTPAIRPAAERFHAAFSTRASR